MKKTIGLLFLTLGLAAALAVLLPMTKKVSNVDTKETKNTTLFVTNQTKDTVTAWLTLSVYTDTLKNYYLQEVYDVFGISDSGSFGSFKIAPFDTLEYTSKLALSGNICFGGQPINCPNNEFPTATNIFEFTINNDFGTTPMESVEISCVSGVNSFMEGYLSDLNWIVTTGIDSVQRFANDTLGNNRDRYGVFPTGCTDCTDLNGAPVCDPSLKFEAPNTNKICIIQRPANLKGGSIVCGFKGFTK